MRPLRRLTVLVMLVGISIGIPCGARYAPAQAAQQENDDQESSLQPTPKSAKKGVTQPTSKSKPTGTARVVRLPKADGGTITVPYDATARGYFEFLKSNPGPKYAVNSIELAGSARKDRVELTATVTVQIIAGDGWVSVPLALQEAELNGKTYEFLGRRLGEKPLTQGTGEEGGVDFRQATRRHWWFKGKGYHRLTFKLIVPVTNPAGWRRLKLTMPPGTASSTLKLSVPVALKQLSASRPKGIAPATKTISPTSSEISVTGLGDAVDLQWRKLPQQRKAGVILQADTFVLLKISADEVEMLVEQRIEALNAGSFSVVTFQLPADFEVSRVKGKHYLSHTAVDDKNRITVTLTEPRSDVTTLRWTLRRKSPLAEGPLNVDGFAVDRARFQEVQIAVEKVQGLKITKRNDGSRSIYQLRTSEFRAPELVGMSPIFSAYKARRQPFVLSLDVNHVDPIVTATPKLQLRLGEDRIDLVGEFHFHVSKEGGAVQEIEIDWPNRNSEQWKNLSFDSADNPGLIETVTLGNKADRTAIRVRLTEQQTEDFVLPIRATRAIAANERLPMRISLPMPAVSTIQQTELTVTHLARQEVEVTAENETVIEKVFNNMPVSQGQSFKVYPEASPTIALRIESHEQKIVTSSRIVAEWQSSRLHVSQYIEFDVKYEPISHVRFKVPTELVASVAIFAVDENTRTRLTPVDPGLEIGSLTEWTFKLTTPVLGRLEFVMEFDLDAKTKTPATESIVARLPVIQTSAGEYADIQLSWSVSDAYNLTLKGDGWSRTSSTDEIETWKTSDKPITEIPLVLTRVEIPKSNAYTIHRALIHTAFGPSGRVQSRGKYRLSMNPGRLVVLFPADIVPGGFWWGSHELSSTNSPTSSNEMTAYRLDIPSDFSDQPTVLTIDFHSREATSIRWWGRHEASAPQFPENVWIKQTQWNVTIPPSHYLFSEPLGFNPQFQWTRGFIFWQREPAIDSAEYEQRHFSGTGPQAAFSAGSGSTYEFQCFGPTPSIAFDSMKGSMIVLFGAGIALGLGILLVKIPSLRSVLTTLSMALLMAIVGLWYLVQVQVLLQPAILGLLLAALLVWIERRTRRVRPDPNVLTISHPDNLLGSASLRKSTSVPYAGSEDVTLVRSAPVGHAEPASASDSRSIP